jgi:hypothetical protein
LSYPASVFAAGGRFGRPTEWRVLCALVRSMGLMGGDIRRLGRKQIQNFPGGADRRQRRVGHEYVPTGVEDGVAQLGEISGAVEPGRWFSRHDGSEAKHGMFPLHGGVRGFA